ncbi:MAG: hypothetical protein PSX37_11370 [bacterium]|nr:hypothetical protein [bacterium]
MPTPPVSDDDSEVGPSTTAEEAMEKEGQVDGHVTESSYGPTETRVDAEG